MENESPKLWLLAALIFLCGFLSDASAAEWVLVYSNSGVNFYYDEDSIEYPDGGIINLKTRVFFQNDQIRNEIIRERRSEGLSVEGWNKLHEIVNLIQIECTPRRYRFVSGSHYDERGNLLDASKTQGEQWAPILANSPMMSTYNAVCNKSTK
jgi:hypothetical protein